MVMESPFVSVDKCGAALQAVVVSLSYTEATRRHREEHRRKVAVLPQQPTGSKPEAE